MMTRADLTEAVSRALDISRKESETIVVTMLDSIVRSLRSGHRVEICWHGSFGTRQRRSRITRAILVKFIRDRLDRSRAEGTSLAA